MGRPEKPVTPNALLRQTPLKPILFDFGAIDLLGHSIPLRIYSYGLMLVLGLVAAMLIAARRARRSGEDPRQITFLGVLALAGGLVGARAAYVIEQVAKGRWAEFVGDGNPIWAAVNISSGGLIYYGGLLGGALAVLAGLRWRRLPVRRYLDIVTVSLLVGLAFGRAGCLLNGCCYGARCDDRWPLAQHFPMYSPPLVKLGADTAGPFCAATAAASPAYAEQFRHGRIRPDERLWLGGPSYDALRPPRFLHGRLASDQLITMFSTRDEARRRFMDLAALDPAGNRPPGPVVTQKAFAAGLAAGDGFLRGSEWWGEAATFDRDGDDALSFEEAWDYTLWRRANILARFDTDGGGDPRLSPAERQAADEYLRADLYALAAAERSLAVRPAQLVAMANALVLAGVLTLFYRVRRREGEVFGLAMVLYALTRFMEEMIRADNSLAAWSSLTHNQVTSALLAAAGVVFMVALRRCAPSCGPAWRERAAAVGR